MRAIAIFDTTLRDGEKSPGTILTLQEKVRLAKQLARLKVDVLEAGFPAASEDQFRVVQQIARQIQGPVIAVLARATNPQDFEVAWKAVQDAEKPRIHTFVPASSIYRDHFLRRDFQSTVELAIEAVTMAKRYGTEVEFSLVDALRARKEEVLQLAKATVDAGATIVNLADTVGYAVPSEVRELIRTLVQELADHPDVVISIHCHNDLGLALANSLAALEAGAGQIHATINGIGERAGNTPVEEVAAAVTARGSHYGCTCALDLGQIQATSRLVRQLTGVNLQVHKPIVGSNAFVFEMNVPQLADSEGKPPYEIIDPQLLGRQAASAPLTEQSTFDDFVQRVEDLGYVLNQEQARAVYEAFGRLAAQKEVVHEADLDLLLAEQLSERPYRYKLLYLNVTAGSISVPNATVQMEIDGEIRQDAGFGHGPVDAAFKTIYKMVRRAPTLVRYEVNAATSGTDALGEVCIRLEENGCFVQGRAADTDIVLASAKALIDGLNKLDILQKQESVSEFTEDESWMPRL